MGAPEVLERGLLVGTGLKYLSDQNPKKMTSINGVLLLTIRIMKNLYLIVVFTYAKPQ